MNMSWHIKVKVSTNECRHVHTKVVGDKLVDEE